MHLKSFACAVIATIAMSAAAPATPLSNSVTRTDDGYVVGSPKAPIQLVVLSSFGCPHCRALDAEMMTPLKRDWIDTGKASLRYVPYGMFPTDVPSLFLAECGSPSTFFERSGSLFRSQQRYVMHYAAAPDTSKKALAAQPKERVPQGLAALSGLDVESPSYGVARAEYAKCLADPSIRGRISTRQKTIEARYSFEGTPSIWVNGRPTGTGSSWPRLEALLRTASSR